MAQISITLPPGSTVKVHVGDVVTFDTVVAQTTQAPTMTQTIPIADSLKFNPTKVFKHLKKNIGDKIYKGDIIATKDAVFATKKFIADADGILTGVNHHSGEITIEHTSGDASEGVLLALAQGTVASVESDAIVCKVAKTLPCELSAPTTTRVGGKVVVTDNAHVAQLTLPQVQGNIILSADGSEYVLSKLEALGASYIITGSLTHTSAHTLVLKDKEEMQAIIDFAPHAVYANASEKSLTFYK